MKRIENIPEKYEFVFTVARPIQLIFAAGIIRQLNISDRSCIIISNDFNDAQGVYKRIRDICWDLSPVTFKFCAERQETERFASKLGPKYLFVDGDVGFKRFMSLMKSQFRMKRPKIWVYEEGLGTYRADLYPKSVKRTLFQASGIGIHMGGSRFAQGVFVRDTELYRKRFPRSPAKIEKIEQSPVEILKRNIEAWADIFNYKSVTPKSNTDCVIYLTNWSIDQQCISALIECSGDRYMKPHPYIKFITEVPGVELLSAAVPAELILTDLLAQYQRITVFHHGSSCERYVDNSNIEFIRINCSENLGNGNPT